MNESKTIKIYFDEKFILAEDSSNMSKKVLKDECFLSSQFDFIPIWNFQSHQNAYRHHKCYLDSISWHFACRRKCNLVILPSIDDFGAIDLKLKWGGFRDKTTAWNLVQIKMTYWSSRCNGNFRCHASMWNLKRKLIHVKL